MYILHTYGSSPHQSLQVCLEKFLHNSSRVFWSGIPFDLLILKRLQFLIPFYNFILVSEKHPQFDLFPFGSLRIINSKLKIQLENVVILAWIKQLISNSVNE